MASASIYIQSKPYSDGNVPIFIRIIHNRKPYLKQIAKVPEDYIDRNRAEIRRKHLHHTRLNQLIHNELTAAQQYLLDCQIKNTPPDPARYFGASPGTGLVECIRTRAQAFYKAGKYPSWKKHIVTANKVERLGMDISVIEINKAWVVRFMDKLERDGYLKRDQKPNTIAKDLSIISAVINEIDGVANPVSKVKKPSNAVDRAVLRPDDVERLEQAPYCEPLDAYLFALYHRGMRFFDIVTLRWSCIDGDRLTYTAQKGGFKKTHTMNIRPKGMAILERYRGINGEYVFSFVTLPYTVCQTNYKKYQEAVNKKNAPLNTALRLACVAAGVSQHVTFHTVRHTYAFIADQAQQSLGMIQSMLGHDKITTTERYLKGLRRTGEMDKAADKLGLG